jgi:hypothetical protein
MIKEVPQATHVINLRNFFEATGIEQLRQAASYW